MTRRPSSTRRAGRVYSSMTSVGGEHDAVLPRRHAPEREAADGDHDRVERVEARRPRARTRGSTGPARRRSPRSRRRPSPSRGRRARAGPRARKRCRRPACRHRSPSSASRGRGIRAPRRRRRPPARRPRRSRSGSRSRGARVATRGRPAKVPRASSRAIADENLEPSVVGERPRDEGADEAGSEDGHARHGRPIIIRR